MFTRLTLTVLFVLSATISSGCRNRAESPDTTPAGFGGPSLDASQNSNSPDSLPEDSEPFTWRFEYDKDGYPVEAIAPGGRVTRYVYERFETGQLRSMVAHLADGTEVATEFDLLGRRVLMRDAAGIVRYEYDPRGRPAVVRRDDGPVVRYQFDPWDRLTLLQVGNWHLQYEYDFLGRLAAVETPRGTIRYQHAPGGRHMTRELPNGIRTTWTFESSGQLLAIEHHDRSDQLILSFHHEYHPGGQIQRVVERTGREFPTEPATKEYMYDTLHRLVALRESGTEVDQHVRYGYDPLGNRTEVARGGSRQLARFDWAGRILDVNGFRCQYDAGGNLVRFPTNQGVTSCTYDPAGRLTTARLGDEVVQYQYDGDGNLVQRDSGGKSRHYVPDPYSSAWTPLFTFDESGSEEFHVWHGQIPLAAMSSESTTWFLEDHLGSTRLRVDGEGRLSHTHQYGPYGELDAALPRDGLTPAFTGLFLDPVCGLYVTRHRAYSPELGQWLQMDPQHRLPDGSQQDLGAYLYCGADPVNFVDIDGAAPSSFEVHHRGTVTASAPRSSPWPGIPRPTWGTETGLKSAQYWAGRYVETNNPVYVLPGLAASLWTPETYKQTTFVLTAPLTGATSIVARVVTGAAQAMRVTDAVTDLTRPGSGRDGMMALASEFAPGLIRQGVLSVGRHHVFRNLDLAITNGSSRTLIRGVTLINTVTRTAEIGDKVIQGTIHGHEIGNAWNEMRGMPAGSGSIRPGPAMYVPFGPIPINLTPGGAHYIKAIVDAVSDYVETVGGPVFLGPTSPERAAVIGSSLSNIVSSYRQSTTRASIIDAVLGESKVGGVYLGGSRVFDEFGQLGGIYIEPETDRILLISQDDQRIMLPSFSLDDLVTVFRSVYSGGAPTVSIDPDPRNPHGDTMLVRHGKETEATRVGWILFEADRVMKGYSMGFDNLTGAPIRTQVPGHQQLFQGTPNPRYWQRFWIRPAEVTVRGEREDRLQLFEVPLEVQTESMILGADGRLTPAPPGASSPFARRFSEWFTRHYEAISDEVRLAPPGRAGQEDPVAVFAELQRIALLTAAAEMLRDQGVPLPAWMMDHQPTPVAVPDTTPAIKAMHTRYSIHGGVSLSAQSETSSRRLALTPADRQLIPDLDAVAASVPNLGSIKLDVPGGKQRQVVALPGQDSRVPGAFQLIATDLVVEIPGETPLALTRKYHSFFRPTGILGVGWSFDLPYLEKHLRFAGKNAGSVQYQVSMRLKNAFGTSSPDLTLYEPDDSRIEREGVMLIQDGKRLIFDREHGTLLAIRDGEELTIYQRGDQQELLRIERWMGHRLLAWVDFRYDESMRLARLLASNGDEAHYEYNAGGHLYVVRSGDGQQTQYQYRDGMLWRVSEGDQVVRELSFSERGELTRMVAADGTVDAVRYRDAASGARIPTVTTSLPNGVQITSTVVNPHRRTESMLLPSGEQHRFHHDLIRNWHAWQLPTGATLVSRHSDQDSTREVLDGKQLMFRATHRYDGRLLAAETGSTRFELGYRGDATINELRITERNRTPRSSELHMEFNQAQQVQRVKENSGSASSELEIDYDDEGRPISIRDGHAAVKWSWNEHGNLDYVESSTGSIINFSSKAHSKSTDRITITHQGKEQVVEWLDDATLRLTQFDGGIIEMLATEDREAEEERVTIRLPNGLHLAHEQKMQELTRSVDCGERFRYEYQFDDAGRLIRLTHAPSLTDTNTKQ